MAVRIILKNSGIADKRPSPSVLERGEITVNQNEDGCFLCCEDTAGNIQQIGGVKLSEDAPQTPVKGTMWLQPSTSTLYIHNGTGWESIAGGGGSGGGGGTGDVEQIIGGDGINVSPASGKGIVSVNADLDTDRGLELQSGKIAVKVGTGLTFDGDGKISSNAGQALTYRGVCDVTSSVVPIDPDSGDAYANVGNGNCSTEWLAALSVSGPVDGDPGDLLVFNGSTWNLIPTGGGGGGTGITNLSYTSTTGGTASAGGTVNSDTGTDADIPMAGYDGGSGAVAGLMLPSDKIKLDGIDDDAKDGTVTSIIPGAGLRNEAVAGLNATPLTESGTISVGLTTTSGLQLTAGDFGGLEVDLQSAGAGTGGLELAGNELKVDSGNGIELTAAGVAVDPHDGITVDGNGVSVDIVPGGGLEFDGGALQIDTSVLPAPKDLETLVCMPDDLPDPADRVLNSFWFNEDDGRLYIWIEDVSGDLQYVDASPDSTQSDFEPTPPAIISATAPTGDQAVAGNLWFNTNDGRTYVYYEDGDSSQWVDASPDNQENVYWDRDDSTETLYPKLNSGNDNIEVGGNIKCTELEATSVITQSVNTGQIAGTRNLLDNGGLTINTRSNDTSQTAEELFICDRWRARSEKPNLLRSTEHRTDANTLTDKVGMPYVRTIWQPTTQTWGYIQKVYIQDWIGINGKQVTLSFLSSVKITQPVIYLQTATNGVGAGPGQHFDIVEEPNPYGSSGFLYTGSTAVLPTDFIKEGQSMVSLYIYATQDITDNPLTHDIAMLQMEIGPVRTEFEHESLADTSHKCRAYFQKTNPIWDVLGMRPISSSGSGPVYANYQFDDMITAPVAKVKGEWLDDPGGSGTPSVTFLTTNSCRLASGKKDYVATTEYIVRSIRSKTVDEYGWLEFDAEPLYVL